MHSWTNSKNQRNRARFSCIFIPWCGWGSRRLHSVFPVTQLAGILSVGGLSASFKFYISHCNTGCLLCISSLKVWVEIVLMTLKWHPQGRFHESQEINPKQFFSFQRLCWQRLTDDCVYLFKWHSLGRNYSDLWISKILNKTQKVFWKELPTPFIDNWLQNFWKKMSLWVFRILASTWENDFILGKKTVATFCCFAVSQVRLILNWNKCSH